MHIFSSRTHVAVSLPLLTLLAFLLTAGGLPMLHMPQHRVNAASQTPSIYYGVHATSWLRDLTPVTTFEQDAKKPVAIVMWYQGWGAAKEREFEPSWMDNVRAHGSIPSITWEPQDYTKGVDQPAYSLQNIINGHFDAYIVQWAKASKAWGHPYFLRFAPEMNGYWFPWSESANGNKAGQYVQAWRHVHDIFTALGVKNVTWVWSPNTEFAKGTALKGLYPGASYVDWVGIDGYNWGGVEGKAWQSFAQVFRQTYNDVTALAPGKPLMIAETASAEQHGNKARWITDAFTVQLPKYFPQVKAVVWFDENKETDWRAGSSAASQAAFVGALASSRYAANVYGKLAISPIPAPGR